MNYQAIYNKIIKYRKENILTMKKCYCEKHHIIPKCMGGRDVDENLINLTGQEHYICHLLLAKIYKGTKYEKKLVCAATSFQSVNKNRTKYIKVNSRLIGYLRERKSYLMSKKYDLNGIKYTLRELSRMYDIPYDTLRRRVPKHTISEALEMGKDSRNNYIEYNGERRTLNEWSVIYNIPKTVLYDRIYNKKLDLKTAFETKVKRARLIIFKGKSKTLKEWAKDLNINYNTLSNRIYHGMSFEQAIEKITVLKIPYNGELKTASEIAKITGASEDTIRRRYYNNKDVGEYQKKHDFIIDYNGKQYTIKEFTKFLHISYSSLLQRLETRSTIEEIVNFERKVDRMMCFGKLMSRKEISEKYQLSIGYIGKKLKEGLSIEEIVTKFNKQRGILFNGKYMTITEIAKMYNIKPRTLRSRYYEKGLSIEDSINFKKKHK